MYDDNSFAKCFWLMFRISMKKLRIFGAVLWTREPHLNFLNVSM